MLKKRPATKSAIIVAFVALVVLAAVGVSYSWFTSSVPTEASAVEMGRLKIGAEFDLDDEPVLYEPGIDASKSAHLSNRGSLPSATLVDISALTTIVSTADGDPLGSSYTIPDDANVTVTLNNSTKIWEQIGDAYYSWYTVKGQPGKLVCVASGPITADMSFDIIFDGPGMGNEYQGAQITLSSKWNATQVLDEAMIAELGVGYDDLVEIPSDSARSFTNSGRQAVQEKIAALFDR